MKITDEKLFNQRRAFLKLGAAGLVSNSLVAKTLNELNFAQSDVDLEISDFKLASEYINFYEFSTNKQKAVKLAKNFDTKNWKVQISGEVENPMSLSMDEFYKFRLQERIYRFRCVEAWAMVVPWIGFSLSKLLDLVKPTKDAKYVKFTTLLDKKQFLDQGSNFPSISYPYVEGLRLDEAYHELCILAVGMYGKKLPNQNGAPIRLVVPWKYGFKSIKSIVKIELTKQQPLNTWQEYNPREYGFFANVNPKVDHPRWSQASERVLGKFFKSPTKLYNGYNEVSKLYEGMNEKEIYF